MAYEFKPSPFTLTALILEVLKTCFSQGGTAYPYVPGDSAASKVSILDALQFKPDEVQKRPAIITKRGAVQINRISFGDVGGKGNNPADRTLIVLLDGSYSVVTLAEKPRESERLAGEVLDCLLCFQTIISKDYGFVKFEVKGIGETFPHQEYTEFFATPITLTYAIEDQWILEQDSLPIKVITQAINAFVCPEDRLAPEEETCPEDKQ